MHVLGLALPVQRSLREDLAADAALRLGSLNSDQGHAAPQQMPIALLGHPFGTGEVAHECTTGTHRFSLGIDVQYDQRDLLPIRPFGIRVQDAQVGSQRVCDPMAVKACASVYHSLATDTRP
jgi:hypothetical protein